MKRILSLILAISLTAGIGILCRADTINPDTQKATQSVQAIYKSGAEALPVISVDVEWKGMSFTYNDNSQPQWDAEKHNYAETEGYWEASEASITLTNHSNAIIQADIAYQALDAFSDTKMFFTDCAPIIGSAETSQTSPGSPCSVTIEVIPGGILSDKAESVTNIGTITVSVSTDLNSSDPHIAAFDKLCTLYEKLVNAGHDPQGMERGTVYIRSAEDAQKLILAIDMQSNVICSTQLDVAQRNQALNELIAMFYSALAIKQ